MPVSFCTALIFKMSAWRISFSLFEDFLDQCTKEQVLNIEHYSSEVVKHLKSKSPSSLLLKFLIPHYVRQQIEKETTSSLLFSSLATTVVFLSFNLLLIV